MSYFTGTANGTNDLLDIIKTNALAEGYTLNRDRVDGTPSTRELFLTATNGAVIGFKLYTESNANGSNADTEDNVNIALNVATSYDDLETFFNQPNSFRIYSGDETGAFCRDIPIKYHLSITSGRIFCAYFLENYCLTFYVGDYWPYDTPTNQPNPLFISGNNHYDTPTDILKELTGGTNIYGDAQFESAAYDNQNNWISLAGSSSWNSPTYKLCISPSKPQDILPTKSGSYVFFPVIMTNNTSGFMFGELDGIYRVSVIGLKEGDLINDGTNDYLVFKKEITDQSDEGLFAFKLI